MKNFILLASLSMLQYTHPNGIANIVKDFFPFSPYSKLNTTNEARSLGIQFPENLKVINLKRMNNIGMALSGFHALPGIIILGNYANTNQHRFVLRHELSHIAHKDSLSRLALILIMNKVVWLSNANKFYAFKFIDTPISKCAKILHNKYGFSYALSNWLHNDRIVPRLGFHYLFNYITSKQEFRADREAIDSRAMRNAAVDFFNQHQNSFAKTLDKIGFLRYFIDNHPSSADRIAQAYKLYPLTLWEKCFSKATSFYKMYS